MIIDVQAELAALPQIELPSRAEGEDLPSNNGGAVGIAIGKLARQQFRTGQQVEYALEQLRQQLEEVRTTSDQRRREIEVLRDDGRDCRLRIVEALDALDDLLVIARQRQESFWLGRLERLGARFADALAAVGVTELPAMGSTFDEYLHEVLETTDAPDGASPHTVVDVIRRGFRHEGAVLRRVQVITTR